MLFEIESDDLDSVHKTLIKFAEMVKEEYKKSITKAKRIIKYTGFLTGGSKVADALPNEIPTPLVYIENNKCYFRLPFPATNLMKIYRQHKKMEKNLRKFLEAHGHKVTVRFLGD